MKSFAFAAAIAVMALSAPAMADDFVALCTGEDKTPEVAKSCACASEKITGADREAALAALKATAAAVKSGKPEDAAAITTNHAKGVEVIMTAQMSCM